MTKSQWPMTNGNAPKVAAEDGALGARHHWDVEIGHWSFTRIGHAGIREESESDA
jgi:hypothetical protein